MIWRQTVGQNIHHGIFQLEGKTSVNKNSDEKHLEYFSTLYLNNWPSHVKDA